MRQREKQLRPGKSGPLLVVLVVLVVLATSCTAGGSDSPTSAPGANEQDGSTAPVPGGALTTCEEVIDSNLVAIQDFLDRLGDISAEEASMLQPIETWLEEYSDLHRGITRLEAFVSDDMSDQNLEALAQSVAEWRGVSAIETVSKEQAIAHARQIFADNPSALKLLNDDPNFIPGSIRLTVAEAEASAIGEQIEAIPGITRTVDSGTPDIRMLAFGVVGLGIAEPYLRQPTADAERLGCADGLLDALKARSDELEPRGSAGAAFIDTLNR